MSEGRTVKTMAFVRGAPCPICNEDMCEVVDVDLSDGTFLISTDAKLYCPDCSPVDQQPETTDDDVIWSELVSDSTLEHRVEQVLDTLEEKISFRTHKVIGEIRKVLMGTVSLGRIEDRKRRRKLREVKT